ncbi:hypothetical protein LIER_43783 [Lithospermum erythrorhizon]|uniref:Uncharacterized protein n=1 Tax=Lithospermum erythrorhizon TaxID=34254 RepID=A0AAV3QU50_LITER
MILPTHFQS